MVEDVDLGRFIELTTSKKIYVNKLNLHAIKINNLGDYMSDFEMIGSMLIGEIEQKQVLYLKRLMVLKTILTHSMLNTSLKM